MEWKYKCSCFALSIALFCGSVFEKTNESSTDVLFIGNSYTYYNSMPQIFKAMAEHRFPDQQINVKFIGHGGATLQQQWQQEIAVKEIMLGEWDYVVLQEQSMLGEGIFENGKTYVRSPHLFFEYATKFDSIIRENGAQTVFYMTWSREDSPDQQKYLSYAYMTAARETQSKIAPVGMAWHILRENPEFTLYEKDGSHPSVFGTYLAALMLFAVTFDTKPDGIPVRLEGFEILRGGKISETKSLLTDLPVRHAEILKDAVNEIYKEMNDNGGYLDVEKAVSEKKPSAFSYAFDYLRDARGQFVFLIVVGGLLLGWNTLRKFLQNRTEKRLV